MRLQVTGYRLQKKTKQRSLSPGTCHLQPGFALIELLVCIAIIMILGTMTYTSFITTNRSKALDTDALKVTEQLRSARSLTLSAKDDMQWGVHLESTSITLFAGASYDAGNSSNVVTRLNPLVTIATTTLAGGGSDVIFQRLSGETTQFGTTTLALTSSTTMATSIVIYKTGVVEMR